MMDRYQRGGGLIWAPTASFCFKDKQPRVADITRSLGVAYVLDGSVRQSSTTLRIAACLAWHLRLPAGRQIEGQDDMASEVSTA